MSLRRLLLPVVLRFVDLAAEDVRAVWAHDLVHRLTARGRKHAACRATFLLLGNRLFDVKHTGDIHEARLNLADRFVTVISRSLKDGTFTPLPIP